MDVDRLKSLWTNLDNCLLKWLRLPAAMGVFFFFVPALAKTFCQPFEIYRGVNNQTPSASLYVPDKIAEMPVRQLLKAIDRVPGHSRFSQLYQRQNSADETNYLTCLYHYIRQDFDRDGEFDWRVASENQIFAWPVPQDRDWDNDGIINLFDSAPFSPSLIEKNKIGRHLRLKNDPDHPLNALQEKIFDTCGVLALNHTDDHSPAILESFLKICEEFLGAYKKVPVTFILYAFASHSLFRDIKASFYPELNFISISGELAARKKSDEERIRQVLGHEIGHFLIFHSLTPAELIRVATLNHRWRTPAGPAVSFFHPLLMSQRAIGDTGYFPSKYSATNMHEWFSEVFSVFLSRRLGDRLSPADPLPASLENWFQKKFISK